MGNRFAPQTRCRPNPLDISQETAIGSPLVLWKNEALREEGFCYVIAFHLSSLRPLPLPYSGNIHSLEFPRMH